MNIEWTFVCKEAIEREDGQIDAKGIGLDWIELATLPAATRVMQVVRIVAEEHEVGKDHSLEVWVIDRDRRVPGRATTFAITDPPTRPGSFPVAVIVPTSHELRVERAGVLWLETYLDGRKQWTLPLEVRGPEPS